MSPKDLSLEELLKEADGTLREEIKSLIIRRKENNFLVDFKNGLLKVNGVRKYILDQLKSPFAPKAVEVTFRLTEDGEDLEIGVRGVTGLKKRKGNNRGTVKKIRTPEGEEMEFPTFKDACDFFGIPVNGDSARRVLERKGYEILEG